MAAPPDQSVCASDTFIHHFEPQQLKPKVSLNQITDLKLKID